MKTRELPILSVVLYILAVIFAVGAATAFYGAYGNVAPAIEQGLDMGFFLRELASLWRNLFMLRHAGGTQ